MTFGARLLSRLRAWIGLGRPAGAAPGGDPIGERLHAAVEAHAHAKAHSSSCYERRVHAMIDELFLRMDRDGRR